MAKIKTKKTSSISDDLIVASIMNASLAIAELDDVVRKFEQAGGRERFAGNKSWLPFLEAVDSLQEAAGQLAGCASELFSTALAASEEAADRGD